MEIEENPEWGSSSLDRMIQNLSSQLLGNFYIYPLQKLQQWYNFNATKIVTPLPPIYKIP